MANDLDNWTRSGSVFAATNNTWSPANYWNVADTNMLFFRLYMIQ